MQGRVYLLDNRHCIDDAIVMELMGRSLEDVLDLVHSLAEARVKYYYKQFLSGLYYMHDRKYAHRDLKYDNILLSVDDHHRVLKLADFGLTKRYIDQRTGLRDMSKTLYCGTEDYRAPEMLDPETPHFDPLVSDIWSAGCVLYKMLYGRLPFSEPKSLTAEHLVQFAQHQRETSVLRERQNSSATLRAFVNAHFHPLESVRAKVDEILKLEWIK